MTGIIIDCKTLSQRIRNEIAEEVAYLQKTYSVTPSLAVIRVGNDAASYTYVQNKKKA